MRNETGDCACMRIYVCVVCVCVVMCVRVCLYVHVCIYVAVCVHVCVHVMDEAVHMCVRVHAGPEDTEYTLLPPHCHITVTCLNLVLTETHRHLQGTQHLPSHQPCHAAQRQKFMVKSFVPKSLCP